MAGHIDKLDPRTGARGAWHDIPYPSIVGGIAVLPPMITPDGNSYAFGYSQRVNDLYSISPPRKGIRVKQAGGKSEEAPLPLPPAVLIKSGS